jgi:hypothetical protein
MASSGRLLRYVLLPCLALALLSGCCVHRGGVRHAEFESLVSASSCAGCEGCDSAPACGWDRGLLNPLRSLLSCGSGCGEWYVDEWLSDPPDCCDPGDNWGNWVGPQPCCKGHGSPLHRRNLWGTRQHHSGHVHAVDDAWHTDGEVIIDERWSEEAATPKPRTT